MNETGEKDCEANLREGPAGMEIKHDQLTSGDDGLVRGFAAPLGRGQVDPKDFTSALTNRLGETEHQLGQLVRSIDRMNRRLGRMELRLTSLTSQASDQEEALRMMCEVLRDLDDPYGFGESLDERLAHRGSNRTTDGGEE